MRALLPATLLALVLAPAAATAYGTLEPVNELGTTLRQTVLDPAAGALQAAWPEGVPRQTRTLDYGEDNATWAVYNDDNHNGRRDEGEKNDTAFGVQLSNLTLRHARVDGNLTDHAQVNATALGLWFRVCTDRHEDALVEGAGRGLRCEGDLDGDGAGDASEVLAGRNPLRPREDRILPLLP